MEQKVEGTRVRLELRITFHGDDDDEDLLNAYYVGSLDAIR